MGNKKESEYYQIEINGENFFRNKESGVREHQVAGTHQGRLIYLPPLTFADRVDSYFHEAGHIIGNEMSFLDGSVLQPDEVKLADLNLKLGEKLSIIKRSWTPKEGQLDSFEFNLVNKILTTFTKGNYDVAKLKLRNISWESVGRILLVLSGTHPTYEIKPGEPLKPLSTREGRDLELPAYVVSKACTVILTNSLKTGVVNFGFSKGETLGSHERAQQIVDRAYQGKGWKLPSYVDMGIVD